MSDLTAFARHYVNPSNASKLQARLVHALRAHQVEQLEENKASLLPEERARWLSRTNQSSAIVWKAFPLTEEFHLSNQEVKFLLTYATGAPMTDLPNKCTCSRLLSLEHAVHCDTAKLAKHNMLQARLVAFAREQAVPTQQNVRLTINDAKNRQEPDIIFYLPRPLETDVTVVNPCAPTMLMKTINKPGSAMGIRAQRKDNKYLDAAQKRGHDFVALAFETHGRMGQEVLDLLAKLAANTADEAGHAIFDMTLDLALTLVRGNALCARRAIARARRRRDQTRSICT